MERLGITWNWNQQPKRENYVFYCKSFHWDVKGICFTANCYYVHHMDFYQTLFFILSLKKKKLSLLRALLGIHFVVSEINVNWRQSCRCWGEVLKFTMMWSKERAEKAWRYSSKCSILAARIFLFSKGSRGETIIAVKKWRFCWACTSR